MNDIYTLNWDNKYEGLPSLSPIQDKNYFTVNTLLKQKSILNKNKSSSYQI